MAQLVAAFGSSHSIMLVSQREDWQNGFRAIDPKNPHYYDRAGNPTTYDALLAVAGDKASALISSSGFGATSNGFSGKSDGLTELRHHRSGLETYQRAVNGNVVQVGALSGFAIEGRQITLALAFGKTPREALDNARASLARGFANVLREYQAAWHEYLRPLARVERKYQPQFNIAVLTLKALEDKTYRGAMIASPSIPWGGGANANEPTTSGYMNYPGTISLETSTFIALLTEIARSYKAHGFADIILTGDSGGNRPE